MSWDKSEGAYTATQNTEGQVVDLQDVIPQPLQAKLNFLKKFWNGFHNTIIVALLSSAIGVYIGVRECRSYYTDKLKESIAAGAMVYDKKLYVVQPKL